MINVKIKSALVATLVLGAATMAAMANSSEYASPSFDPKHSGSFTAPNEWIDNFSGSLNIVDKDIVLPGPNGFDLAITRWYSSKISQWDHNCILQSREVGPLGVGWEIHQGRLWDNPSGPDPVPAYRIELPGGVQQPFYNNDELGVPNADYVSPGGWSLRDGSCVGAAGICKIATSPSGTEYHFPQSTAYRMDPGNSYLYVRTIRDPVDNRITVDYDFSCNCNQAFIDRVTDAFGRVVQFHYTDTNSGPGFCSLDASPCNTTAECDKYCEGSNTQTCSFDAECVANCDPGGCVGGANPGLDCHDDDDCGTVCVGGANDGLTNCQSNAYCGTVCNGGANDGLENCQSNAYCGSICIGGPNNGQQNCFDNGDCGTVCVGGANNGLPNCQSDAACSSICDGGANDGMGNCQSNFSCGKICVGGANDGMENCQSNSACSSICVGGANDGMENCQSDFGCGKICVGGANDGMENCQSNFSCGKVCVGGDNDGLQCVSSSFCVGGGQCVEGQCVQGQCHEGTCVEGTCLEGSCEELGTCSFGQCTSGTCVTGMCIDLPPCDGQCLDSVCLTTGSGGVLDRITVQGVNGLATYEYTVDEGSHIDPVLQAFETPTGQITSYVYTPGPGDSSHDLEIKRINIPTGGAIDYAYDDHVFFYPLQGDTGENDVCTRVVVSKSVGTNDWTFSWPDGTPGDRTTIVTDPQNAQRRYTYFRYADTGPDRIWKAGLLERLEIVDAGTTLLDESYTYQPLQISGDNVSTRSGYIEFATVGRQIDKVTVEDPGNKLSRVETGGFDVYGNPGWQREYGYGGALYRQTEYEYAHQSIATFENAHIVDRATLIRTESAGGSKVGETINTYDGGNGGGNAFGNVDNTQTWTGTGYVTESFQYDANGDPTERVVSGGGITRTTDYLYNYGTLDRVIQGGRTLFDRTIDPDSSLVTAEQNANGGTTSFGFDNWSRLTSINPPGSDPTTNINYGLTTITVTRGSGHTLYTYDSHGRLTTNRTRISGSTYAYEVVNYDSRGEVLRQYEPSHSSNPPASTTFSRDALGRPLTANGPDGSTTFSYTADETTISDGVSTRKIKYDAFGRIVQVREGSYTTTYEYDHLDNLTRVDGPGSANDRVFVWSPAGWLLSESHPETGLIQYSVNGVGERTSKSNSDGQTESYDYDAEGRTIEIDRPGADNDVHYYYDGDPVPGHSASYTNASGYLTGMTDTTGSTVWTDRDVHGRVQRIEHLRDGNLYVTDLQYNSQGDLSLVDYPRIGATSRSTVTYAYNDAGLVNGVWLNGTPIVTNVEYNSKLTPDYWVYANGVSVNIPTSESERNRPTEISTVGATSNGGSGDVILNFDYNSRGQVSSIVRNGVPETYNYEPDRAFLTSVNGGGTVTYGYDADGNMSSRSSSLNPALNFNRTHSNNRINGCTYSNSGNLLTCEGHDYTYTTNARLDAADGVVQFTYDGNDRVSETLIIAENRVLSDFHTEVLGRLSRFEGPAGATPEPKTDWIYAAGQLVATVDHADACCTPTTCEEQGAECGTIEDGCGNDLSCGTCSAGDECVNNVCVCEPQSCSQQGITCGSATDGCGNPIYCGSCGGGGGGCPINKGFKVLQDIMQAGGDDGPGIVGCNGSSLDLEYTATVDHGNGPRFVTVRERGTIPPDVGVKIPVSLDARNVAVGRYSATITLTFDDPSVDPVVVPVQYEVTAELKLAAESAFRDRESLPIETQTIEIEEEDPGGGGGGKSGATDPVIRWYVADHRGSTMLVLDEVGEVLANYEYFPFGEIKSQSSTCASDEGVYQGSLRDPYSNLYDLGVRHHSPRFARFLVPDVVWPDLRLPADWNLYLYSSNDPINLIDILGYATTTKNGGSNQFRNVDLYDDPRGYEMVLEVAANAIGDTVSDLLALDVIADGVALAGDSSNSVGQRAWGATKAAGTAIMDVAGGTIVKKGLGLLGKARGLFNWGDDLARASVRGNSSVRLASTGLDTASAKVVRTIQKGEKIDNIINEAKQLTYTTGNEHALVSLTNGERVLVSGGQTGINLGNLPVRRVIGHTHPYQFAATGPSGVDFSALQQLGQRSSYLLEHGELIRFSAP